jgi:hypothetical protein
MPPKRIRTARGDQDPNNNQSDAESKLGALLEELDVEGKYITVCDWTVV